ncbi:uncharacterized protein LOC111342906 [Stylophora pistillata]|uniref:Uncharacterized protein n=1 Tax=Stylophora pistillata TaxID=50429 RepID=A0A2B4RGI2_STYPI|nr:uncharacterized protein LOC111342906 [Stylophora pistillata]PFX15919.1 hypothetical protein AWC38_SpisGene19834 [Stylophora pistillata]
MKTSLTLAFFAFVLAVGLSVAVPENEFAEIADEFEAEKLRGGYDMKANEGEFDEEDLEDEDMVIPAIENDMVTEDEQFDERAFDNDDDGDDVSDEDDVSAVEKSADPIRFRRVTRRLGRRVRRLIRRRRPRPFRRVRRIIRRVRRRFRPFRG